MFFLRPVLSYALLMVLMSFQTVFAQFYEISGVVSNSAMEPIAYAEVAVEDNGVLNTKTDLRGRYSIRIAEGSYVLVFTMKGYKTLKIPVTVNYTDVVQNCILESAETEIRGVRVSVRKTDRSEEIIRKVVEGKYRYLNRGDYSAQVYIRAAGSESSTGSAEDSIAGTSRLAEVYLTLHSSSDGKIREERSAVDLRGDVSSLFFLSHTEGDFNLYRNLIELPALSQSPMLSPLSNSGLIAYRYKMLKIYVENGQRLYRIKVSPGMLGNALMSGELLIEDSSWRIRSLKLSLPAYHMAEYDRFELIQEYGVADSHYVLNKMEFRYSAKQGKTLSSGRTVVYYSQYKHQAVFARKFFGNELSSTSAEAYERDSMFWRQIRKEPFTAAELAYLRSSDSFRAVSSQKSWQDSADAEFNRITFKKLFFTGQGAYKRSAERYWELKPLAFVYTPVYLAGARYSYWVSYQRTFRNKKELSVMPSLNYGVLNRDLKGSFTLAKLYDPFRRGWYNLRAGSDFGVINPYNSWIRSFARNNFYAHDFVHGNHRIEIFNGFYIGSGIEYARRRSIADMKFDERGDSLWGGNTILTPFQGYNALYGLLSLHYVPFQKYIREPYQKLILGSRWPEFSLRYRKGLPVLGSTVDFDYLEFGIEQELKIGLAGVSKYRVLSGEFLNTRDLRLVDYKFQHSTGPFFFANPLYSFQGIDSSYATLQRFWEGHYFHRFNGALINKIPLLKKLNISECAGGGLLLSRERNMRYAEVFAGVEKMLRIWKERVRIGVFYVANFNNLYEMRPQFKFTIEVYNKVSNRWPY